MLCSLQIAQRLSGPRECLRRARACKEEFVHVILQSLHYPCTTPHFAGPGRAGPGWAGPGHRQSTVQVHTWPQRADHEQLLGYHEKLSSSVFPKPSSYQWGLIVAFFREVHLTSGFPRAGGRR